VEAYLATAGAVVAQRGSVVICGDARAGARVERGAEAAGLFVHARGDVIPREHESPLFAVWTLGRISARAPGFASMTLRDAAGERTDDAKALRRFSGLEE
jgi:hypothetical protein